MNLLLLAALAATSMAGSKPDDMCAHLKAFHMAPFDGTVQPKGRRWIELHWVGGWMDFDKGWGFRCRHSPDHASSNLCAWIVRNVSYEFPDSAPQRILTCHGYDFRRHDQWHTRKDDISLLDHGRWLKLEVDFVSVPGNAEGGAFRLSSFAKGEDDALVELPPLTE